MNGLIDIPFAEAFAPLVNEHWDYKIYYGGRGGAKSWQFAIALLTLGMAKKLRILCTREIQNSIKDSVHKVLSDLIEKFELSNYEIKRDTIVNHRTGTEFIFKGLLRNSQAIKSTEGINICWVEEAQAVSLESLKTLDPTIREDGAEIWFSLNRFSENDPVWNEYCRNINPKTTLLVKVNHDSNPWFPYRLRQKMEYDKVNDYEGYLHVWEGEPLGQHAGAAISRAAINKAIENNIEKPEGGVVVGADIAREGDDKIVFYMRKGLKVIKERVLTKLRIPATARSLKDFVDFDKTIPINIDSTGMPGVGDLLDEDGYNTHFINFGSNAKDVDRYNNCVSEMWCEFKNLVESDGDIPDLPDDLSLKEELSDRLLLFDKKERKIIEPKKDYKKRAGRSPDRADALIMCFYNPKTVITGEVKGFSQTLISDRGP